MYKIFTIKKILFKNKNKRKKGKKKQVVRKSQNFFEYYLVSENLKIVEKKDAKKINNSKKNKTKQFPDNIKTIFLDKLRTKRKQTKHVF